MCLALWKIILVGVMIGCVTSLPAPPPPATGETQVGGVAAAAEPNALLTTGGKPEGGDLDTANTFLYGLYGGGGYYGGGYRGYGHRGYGYGYPSYYGGGGFPSYYGGYGGYGGFW